MDSRICEVWTATLKVFTSLNTEDAYKDTSVQVNLSEGHGRQVYSSTIQYLIETKHSRHRTLYTRIYLNLTS